mgnify:CR=1 FL=1
MKDIYQRLKTLGVDAPFVRSRILPDWWDDAQATVPATRAVAEFAISRFLGIPIADLRDPTASLALPAPSHAKLKLRSDATREKVAPGLALADRAARLVVDLLGQNEEGTPLPDFTGTRTAAQVRQHILEAGELVTLGTLLEFAWSNGIAVVHLADVPKGSKTFDGMACFVEQVPVVVLASRRQSPPWVAFHLAHELGHLLLGHARAGGGPVVDAGLDAASGDPLEREADVFALEVLTGSRKPSLPTPSLTGPNLAAWASRTGALERIDPGTLSLVYGRERRRMPVAQLALARLHLDVGAQGMAAEALAKRVPEGLPEDLGRLLAPEPTTA